MAAAPSSFSGSRLIGAFFGPVWAGAALAGYLLGAGEGALAAAVACVVVEALGIALGRPAIGVVVTGGPPAAILSFDHMPATLLSAAWLAQSRSRASARPASTGPSSGMSAVTQPLALVVQPALWASAAAAAGLVRAEAERRRSSGLSFVAVVAGTSRSRAGYRARLLDGFASLRRGRRLALAFVASTAIALAFVAVWERVFPVAGKAPHPPPARRVSMASEDADVDELLRLIATAEDKLATQAHDASRSC